jgi:hypothetical protein
LFENRAKRLPMEKGVGALEDFFPGLGFGKRERCKQRKSMSEPSESAKSQEPRIRDFVAVGAGPHSLAVVSRLLETKSRFYTDHDLTTKRKYYQEVDEESKPLDVVVVDPAGSWMARWHSAFDQMKIKFLRSPVTAHPGTFQFLASRCISFSRREANVDAVFLFSCCILSDRFGVLLRSPPLIFIEFPLLTLSLLIYFRSF